MRHALGNDDDVALFDLTACEAHHRPITGWAVQDRRHFVVDGGSCPVDDRSASDESPAARNDDISFGGVVMVDAVRTCRTGAPFAACGLRIRRRRRATACIAGGSPG